MKLIEKSFSPPLLLSIFIFFIVSGCNEDEEASIISNGFTIDETFHSTEFGYLRPTRVGETILFFEIYLASEALDITDPDFLDKDFNSLDIISFTLVPNVASQLPTGNISYADLENPSLIQAKFFAAAATDINRNEENAILYDIIDGEMSLEVENKTYDLSFNLITDDGEIVEGSFKGELIEN